MIMGGLLHSFHFVTFRVVNQTTNKIRAWILYALWNVEIEPI
jgi:hypothetical protein